MALTRTHIMLGQSLFLCHPLEASLSPRLRARMQSNCTSTFHLVWTIGCHPLMLSSVRMLFTTAGLCRPTRGHLVAGIQANGIFPRLYERKE